jgi:hypothetical protein
MFILFAAQFVTNSGVTFMKAARIVLFWSKSPLLANILSLSLQKCLFTWLKHASIGLYSGE